MEPTALLSWLVRSLPPCEGEVSLLQLHLALALAQAQADQAGEAIAPPKERHLTPGVCGEVE